MQLGHERVDPLVDRGRSVAVHVAQESPIHADGAAHHGQRSGQIGGAAIDVLAQEPPVDGNPLLAADIPHLIVTPHTAWAATESRQRAIDELTANVADWLAGGRRGRVV